MTGSSTGTAPRDASSALSADACCRVRVTSTRLPKSGLVSNQRICSRIAATGPTIVTAGGRSPASCTRSTTVVRSADTDRCCGVEPHSTTHTGVSGGLPADTSAPTIEGSVSTPISTTSVSTRAIASQSTPDAAREGSSLPVTTAKLAAILRCVTGMPAYAAAAMADVTPGTTSKGHRGRRERQRLLAPAAEDERVAALEPHHPLSRRAVLDQQRADLLLRHQVVAAPLARVDHQRVRPRVLQQLLGDEPVVHNDVGRPQQRQPLGRNEAGVARTRAHQRDFSRAAHAPASVSSADAPSRSSRCASAPPSASALTASPDTVAR